LLKDASRVTGAGVPGPVATGSGEAQHLGLELFAGGEAIVDGADPAVWCQHNRAGQGEDAEALDQRHLFGGVDLHHPKVTIQPPLERVQRRPLPVVADGAVVGCEEQDGGLAATEPGVDYAIDPEPAPIGGRDLNADVDQGQARSRAASSPKRSSMAGVSG